MTCSGRTNSCKPLRDRTPFHTTDVMDVTVNNALDLEDRNVANLSYHRELAHGLLQLILQEGEYGGDTGIVSEVHLRGPTQGWERWFLIDRPHVNGSASSFSQISDDSVIHYLISEHEESHTDPSEHGFYICETTFDAVKVLQNQNREETEVLWDPDGLLERDLGERPEEHGTNNLNPYEHIDRERPKWERAELA